MMMQRWTNWALRVSLAAAFFSAVADRLGWCGPAGAPNVAWGAWQPFVEYTGTLLFFVPSVLVPAAALAATFAEVALGIWLLVGWRLKEAAFASAVLLLTFGVTMTLSAGIKAPLNYSVFTAAAAALALAVLVSTSARRG